MKGRVVSVKMMHSASVLIEGKKTHPLYKKSFVWSKKYLVDDPIGVKLGDIVEILKTKPVSKRKHWVITKVIGADFVALAEEHLKEKTEEAIEEIMPEEKLEEESSVISPQTEEVKTEEKKKKVIKPRVRKEKSDS